VDVWFMETAAEDYFDAAVDTVVQTHVSESVQRPGQTGDILVFLTGQEEIQDAADMLTERMSGFPESIPKLHVCPLYAALPADQQMVAFQPAPKGTRKVVLATNIAETSVTIAGIKFVVDTGVAKVRQYMHRTGMDKLQVRPISMAEAWQRSGRAGRDRPGMCFRLYSEKSFLGLNPSATPEIMRSDLSHIVLQLKGLNVADVVHFPFLSMPRKGALKRAQKELMRLQALTNKKPRQLTKMGAQMAKFPLSPAFARALILSARPEYSCAEEVLSIVAMLSADNSIFISPKQTDSNACARAAAAKLRFADPTGDHLTLLNVYRAYAMEDATRGGAEGKTVQFGNSPKHQQGKDVWCRENFVNHRTMRKVKKIRRQLVELMKRLKLPVTECEDDGESVRQCLLAGMCLNVAGLHPDGSYRTMCDKEKARIHPSSVLAHARNKPAYLIYNELVSTKQQYMRNVTAIETPWLYEHVPQMYASPTEGR
jgi:ATP-dependent RNA helicase DHX8/PRP22